jgi:hypothetical protein
MSEDVNSEVMVWAGGTMDEIRNGGQGWSGDLAGSWRIKSSKLCHLDRHRRLAAFTSHRVSGVKRR